MARRIHGLVSKYIYIYKYIFRGSRDVMKCYSGQVVRQSCSAFLCLPWTVLAFLHDFCFCACFRFQYFLPFVGPFLCQKLGLMMLIGMAVMWFILFCWSFGVGLADPPFPMIDFILDYGEVIDSRPLAAILAWIMMRHPSGTSDSGATVIPRWAFGKWDDGIGVGATHRISAW